MRALETAQRAGMRRLQVRTASGYRDMSLTGYLAAWPESHWDEIDVEEVKCRPLLLRLEDLIRASRIDLTWVSLPLMSFLNPFIIGKKPP